MNIIAHLFVGIIGYIITGNVLFLIGRVIPDIPLIYNEYKIRKNKKIFNDKQVDKWSKLFYRIFHSLFILIPAFFIGTYLALGILIHQVIDWFTHRNSFTTIPLYPIKYQFKKDKLKKALLLSGGYDSVACLYMINKKEYDYFFFEYNQSYVKEELKAVKALARKENIKVNIIKKDWTTDIKNRNFMMISTLQEKGYNHIVIGSRNILPMFDKYKDSNYVYLKLYGFINRIEVELPVAWFSKSKIIKKIPKDILSKLYSTEK